MSNSNNIKKLLDTMELIHYIEKFKNKIFVLVVTGEVDIRDIIPDIIILQSFNIKVVIVIGYTEKYKDIALMDMNNKVTDIILEISGLLKRNDLDPLPSMGTEVFARKLKDRSEYARITGFDLETIEFALKHNKIPIIAPLGIDDRGRYHKLDEKEIALELACKINSNTIFYVSEVDGIEINNKKYQYLNYNQVKDILDKDNIEDKVTKEILSFSYDVMNRGIKEFSILKGETGNIYQEVLTYDISGTVISKVDDEKIRRAEIEDISSIYLLIKNEVARNNLLPVNEDGIEDDIDSYIVYEIDNSIVAVGKLSYYDENIAEIAKIATFPRYQGGQRAREICKALIEKAREEGLEGVFGLTINPAMMKLFQNLGFEEIDRADLPEKWKEHYDFSRPSRAFYMELLKNG